MAGRLYAATWSATARGFQMSAGSTSNHIGATSPSETSVSRHYISLDFTVTALPQTSMVTIKTFRNS